jgi:peptide/nickel transport system permease protein
VKMEVIAPQVPDPESDFFAGRVESFWNLVWKRFRRHKMALAGLYVLGFMALVAICAPLLSPFGYEELHLDVVADGIPVRPGEDARFWLGTDQLGRDYLTRCIYGGRISLSVGIVSVAFSLAIGIPLGCLAGYYGGLVDMVIMRVVELFSCIPSFFLILTVNAAVKTPSIFYVMAIIGFFGWMGICRQVRAQFLSLRQQEFVKGAVALGFKDSRVIFRHVLPNALTPVIVAATMRVASAIMTESSLSYLGLGVQEPIPSWGAMLKAGQSFLRDTPHMAVIPGLLILIVTLSLNSVGDGLRDALDPRGMRR